MKPSPPEIEAVKVEEMTDRIEIGAHILQEERVLEGEGPASEVAELLLEDLEMMTSL
jgi:hypothetical protein